MSTELGVTAPAAAWVECYIGLGSNLENPLQQVNAALTSLNATVSTTGTATIKVQAVSSWYCSKALGPGVQPDYVNGVAKLATCLSPAQLLAALHVIERQQGRERRERWAARTLDLDILLYGDKPFTSAALEIPHPRLKERNFVIYPLAEIAPTLTLPCGTSLQTLRAHCDATGLQPLAQ